MKKIIRLIAIALATLMLATIGVACTPEEPIKFTLAEDKTFVNFERQSRTYNLPEVNCNKQADFDYTWQIESGEDFVTLLDGNKFSAKPLTGVAILTAVISHNGNAEYARLNYEINVTLRVTNEKLNDISSSQYANPNYTANGIGKRRVFGLDDLVDGQYVKAKDEFEISTPSYAGPIDFTISSSNEEVATATLDDLQENVTVNFISAGTATITILSTIVGDFGRYAFYSYTYNIVDAVNCYTYADIDAVDKSAQADIANIRDIVIRANIETDKQATRFYGNVHGNGYKIDAKAYAEKHTNYPNSPLPMTGDISEDQAAFYMMSSNTTMDNITLIGDSREKNNLNDYGKGLTGTNKEFINVLAVNGWVETKNRPEGIVFKNSVFERGYRLARVSGANNPEKPIRFDTCVFRKSGQHGLYIASDEPASDGNNFDTASEISCYVDVHNVIMYETRFPPIGLLGGSGDDFGSAYGIQGNFNKASQLRVTGYDNYFFGWLKKSEIDYGKANLVGNSIDLANQIRLALEDKANNEEAVNMICATKTGEFFPNAVSNLSDPYFNVIIFGDYAEQNIVIMDDSNYAGAVSASGGKRWQKTADGSLSFPNIKSHTCIRVEDSTPYSGFHFPLSVNLTLLSFRIDIYTTISIWMQYNKSNIVPADGQKIFYADYQLDDEGNLSSNVGKAVSEMTPAI